MSTPIFRTSFPEVGITQAGFRGTIQYSCLGLPWAEMEVKVLEDVAAKKLKNLEVADIVVTGSRGDLQFDVTVLLVEKVGEAK